VNIVPALIMKRKMVAGVASYRQKRITGIDANILCGNMIFEASANVVRRG
jgi:hypothetical protein